MSEPRLELAWSHYRRCHVCGYEVEVDLGPESYSLAQYELARHIQDHSVAELVAFALRYHEPAPAVSPQPTKENE